MFEMNIENLKTLKYHVFEKKKKDLYIAYSKYGHKYKKNI